MWKTIGVAVVAAVLGTTALAAPASAHERGDFGRGEGRWRGGWFAPRGYGEHRGWGRGWREHEWREHAYGRRLPVYPYGYGAPGGYGYGW